MAANAHMFFFFFSSCTICLFYFFGSLAHAQQSYIAGPAPTCSSGTDTSPTINGYSCNGYLATCKAFLTFTPKYPYDTVDSISNLLSSNPSQIVELNHVSGTSPLQSDITLVIPVTCSCSQEYYQVTASYLYRQGDTYDSVANAVYQGLTTCQALWNQESPLNLGTGTTTVPLRCACPTGSQLNQDLNFLLTYAVSSGDTVSNISAKFGVDTQNTLDANGLSSDCTIYPMTTLLVPLQSEPSLSGSKSSPAPSTQSSPPPPSPESSLPPPARSGFPPTPSSPNPTWKYIVAAASVLGLLGMGTFITLRFALFDKCIQINLTTKKKNPLN